MATGTQLNGVERAALVAALAVPAHEDILGQFLCDSLVVRRVLHERSGAAYLSLRKWCGAIRKQQISCLTAIKRRPGPDFVDAVACEMRTALNSLSGTSGIANVVPIPPGSSGKADSLSIQIAQSLARELNTQFADVLVAPEKTALGRSHPKKSAGLRPYLLRRQVYGLTVLVDDVATSGRHIELGLKALRAADAPVLGLVWIAP